MRDYSIGIDEINRILSNQKRKNVQSTDIDSPTLKKVGGSISVEEEKTPEQQVITQKKSGFSDWLKGNKIDLKAESEQMRLKSNQNKYNNSHDEELTSDLRKWSNPEYKMTSEDKAKFKEYQKRISLGGTYGYKYADLIGEQLDNFKKVSDKVNPIASFAIGATDNAVGKTIMNIAATDEEKEELKQALSNARKQSPIPTLAGQLGTNVALYGVGSKAMQAIPAISNLTGKMGNAVGKKAGEVANLGGQYLFDKGAISAGSKILGANIGKGIANSTANILGDTILDVALDTVPTTIENVKSGMSVGEVAKEAGKNIGTNLAFNVGGEAISNVLPALKKAIDLKSTKKTEIPSLADNISYDASTLVKQSNEPAKALEQSAKPDAVEISNTKMVEDAQRDGFTPTLYKNGTGINAYEPKRIEQLSSSKGKVNGKDSFADFIKESKVKKNGNQEPIRYYFGTVSDELADDIFVNTGIDLEGYNIAVRDDEIRHFFNNHGSAKNEALRGQIGVTDAIVEKLPSVFNKPDSIKISTDKDYGGRVVIQIEKRIDGHVVTLNGISKGKHNLEIDTIRIHPTDTKKISTAHTVNGNSPIPKTPETSMGEGYFSDLSISNPQNDVNSIAKEVSKKFDINNYPDATDAYKSAKKNIHNMFNMFGSKEQEQTVMNAVNEFVENPSIEKYIEVQNLLKNEADKLVGTEYSYRGDKARKIGKTRKFDEEYDYMSAYDSINELYNSVRDRAKSNVNKVMAEDIGLGKESISIPVSEDGTVGKVSKSRTNTLENSGINTSDELANKYLNENNFKYEDISEKETMSIAKSRIDDGIDKWKNKLMSQDEFTASDIDTMMMIYSDTVNRARQSGDEELWKEAGTIFKKIQESGTKSGQSIQAFAKWSRNTPEGIVSDTFRDISKKVKKQVGEKKADEIIGQLTVDLQKDIYELAEKAFTSGLDSREGKESFAEIGKIVNKNTPKTLKGVVKSYLMDSMLLNFRTLISRNSGGNLGYNAMEFIRQPISAGIDTAVSKVTGTRTRTGWSKDKITSALSGLAKGVSDEAKDFKKGIHTAKSGQNSITDAIYANSHPFKGNNIITKSLNKIDDLTKHGLSIGDRPFYESAYKQRIVELNDLRKKGLLSEDIMKLSDDDFNVMAELSAKLDGLTATYQDDGAMGKALDSIKKAVGDLSIGTVGTDILSQFVMPFTKTPGNIITRSLEYSPYGAVKNAIITADELRKGNFNQQRFVDETGRNLMGAGLFGLGIAAYDKGFINGGYSDDKDMANAQKQSGMQEYALNTGAGNFDISWLPVIGNDLVAAASFKEAADNSDDVPNAIWEGAKTGLNTLVNTSTLQGMNRMFGGNSSYNSDMDLFGNIGESITSGFGQAIPSLLRQATQSADPYQRNISSGDREYWQNNLMSSLPVFRQKLQPKVDNEGNIMMNNQGRDLGSRIVENMISPGKYTELQDSVVNNEAMRLFESTGNEYSFLPTANRNDIKNGDIPATDEQFFNYQVSLGKKNSEVAQYLIESEFYNTLSDEEKESALSDVYKAMKVVAKEEFVDGYSSDNKIASAYKTNGTKGVIDYMQKQHELKSRGLKDTDKTSAIYEERGLEGLDEYAEYTSVLKNADVSTSKAYENIYKDKGVDALETAVDIVKSAGGSSVKNVMPVLKNSNMTVSEKGEYLQYFVGDLPKGATEAKNTFGYSGVYNYYLHKNSADSDRNGSVSAKEVESYLRNIQMAENMRAQWFDILTNVKKNPFK